MQIINSRMGDDSGLVILNEEKSIAFAVYCCCPHSRNTITSLLVNILVSKLNYSVEQVNIVNGIVGRSFQTVTPENYKKFMAQDGERYIKTNTCPSFNMKVLTAILNKLNKLNK